MAIKKPIPISFGLDSHNSVQSVCAVIHIDDKNTETLDLSLMQGGEHIAVSQNSTVTARFVRVKDKILISDNVTCTVQENGNIHIPIDNAAAHMLVGEIKIEVNIVDENDILTMQFPLVIKVNNTILADAEISPESEGTIPELLEEAREAAESATQAAEAATEAISTKQDKLTAGENITISDNNVISAESGGVTSYNDLTDKPSINNVTLSGNKSSGDLNLQDKLTAGQNITITEENVISASSGSNDYTELENKPSINNVTLSGNKSSDDLNLQGKLTAGNNITINNGVISASGGVTSYNELENKPKIHGIRIEGNQGHEAYNLFGLSRPLRWMLNFGDLVNDSAKNGVLNATIHQVESLPEFMNPKDKHFIIFDYQAGDQGIWDIAVWIDAATNEPKMAFRAGTNNIYSVSDWVELTGGSQIVSGVVNANGTVTLTDSSGGTVTTSGSNIVTSGNEQISIGYDNGGFYFLFDDGQEGE